MLTDPSAVRFKWVPGKTIPDDTLLECVHLFNEHYGVWEKNNPLGHSGRVRLSKKRIHELFSSDNSWIALAYYQDSVIGYVATIRLSHADLGYVTWVTQLVVREEFRNFGVAKRLLSSVWGFTDHFAWGIITPNPYAIRALEKTTGRRCDLDVMNEYILWIGKFVDENIIYAGGENIVISSDESIIRTNFYVSHSEIDEMIERASKSVDWSIGKPSSGEEWLAVTFSSQPRDAWTQEDIKMALMDSDNIVRMAYERMSLGTEHRWAQNTSHEVDILENAFGLRPGAHVLDFGCGPGRHLIELGKRGYGGVGVDFVDRFIDVATEDTKDSKFANVDFRCADCRDVDLQERFEAAICLYDVIGSFPNDTDNDAILINLIKHVNSGGLIIISVMNIEMMEHLARCVDDITTRPDILSSLPPSKTMQSTGQIFSPEHCVIESNTSLVYRKEQFDRDDCLPSEVIVRDRRYRIDELSEKLLRYGVRRIWARCVQSGHWDVDLRSTDSRAKEILYLGQKL